MPAFTVVAFRRIVPIRVRARATVLAILALFGWLTPVRAAEVRLLAAASIQEVFKEIIGDFERASGHRVIIHYGTMGAITDWMRGGEEADLVISSLQSISTLVKEGKVDAASQTTISRVGVGMVVPAGTTVPVIATVEDFNRALLAAKTIVYPTQTAAVLRASILRASFKSLASPTN